MEGNISTINDNNGYIAWCMSAEILTQGKENL